MFSLHIREDAKKYRENNEIFYSTIVVTPNEAIGEIVKHEMPGTMGYEYYRIAEIDMDKEFTTLINIHTGGEYKVGNGMLPPNFDRFTLPEPGATYNVYWKEHMTGSGDWVRTTPKVDSKRGAQEYRGRYIGHEKTRIVSQTYTYNPPGLYQLDIKVDGGEPTVYYKHDIEHLDKVYAQVNNESLARYSTIGQLYINADNEVVYYDIDYEYQVSNYSYPFHILDAEVY